MKFLISILFTMFFLNVSANAGFLYDKQDPVCIDNFYIKSSKIYYLKSKTGNWNVSYEDNSISYIHPGFTYDPNTNKCNPDPWLILGMDAKDFNFLLALIGVFMGFIFAFSTIYLFMTVGGKK